MRDFTRNNRGRLAAIYFQGERLPHSIDRIERVRVHVADNIANESALGRALLAVRLPRRLSKAILRYEAAECSVCGRIHGALACLYGRSL